MSLSIDIQILSEMLDNLQVVTGRRITLIDTQGQVILNSTELCQFCQLIQKNNGTACTASDLKALEVVKQNREPYVFRCHAGLCEAMVPVVLGQKTVAVLMLGQFLDDSPIEQQWACARSTCATCDDAVQLRSEFLKLPQFDQRTIQAYVGILGTFASYISLKNLVGEVEHDESQLLSDYIDKHLFENLSLRTISLQLGISRTNLCKIAREQLNGSIFQIIKDRRLHVAKNLLVNSSLPVARIGEQVGYHDGNYFSRVFTAAYGCSPTQYRKQYAQSLPQKEAHP